MSFIRGMYTNFTAGELTPRLNARVDFDKYKNGCKILENAFIYPQGGAVKRPGTKFISEVKTSSKYTRLIPFNASGSNSIIIELGEYYMRFYKNGEQVLDGLVPYEITTPYLADDLDGIQFTQSADVIFLAHENYPVQKLSHYDDNDWVIENFEFAQMPMLTENVTDTTFTISNVFGTGLTITASADTFASTDVGRHVSVETGTFWTVYKITAFTDTQNVTVDAIVTFGDDVVSDTKIKPSAITGAGITITSYNSIDVFLSTDVGKYIALYHEDGYGLAEITGFTSESEITVTVTDDFAATDYTYSYIIFDLITDVWRLGAFSATSGYPKCITFHQNRLCFAATITQPETIWMSKTDTYDDFGVSSDVIDSDSITATLASAQVNKIRWIESGRRLTVGTSGSEWVVYSSGSGLAHDDIVAERQTSFGCAPIQPLLIDNRIIFIQGNTKRIREFAYNYYSDAYDSSDMLLLAEHLTNNLNTDNETRKFKSFSYQKSPDTILWCIASDGILLTATYLKDQQVIAWSRNITSGSFESVAITTNEDTGLDDIYFVVARTVNGQTVRYVEQMQSDYNSDSTLENCWYVDSGVEYSGAAISVLTGLDHLEGETVNVLGDGGIQTQRTVMSGQIDLDRDTTHVIAGLPYTMKISPVPYEGGSSIGNFQTALKRITKMYVRLLHSRGGLYGKDEDNLEEFLYNTAASITPGVAPAPFTGDIEIYFDHGWQKESSIYIEHSDPQPFKILGIIFEANVND